jgi:hypothetical protein
MTPLSTPFPDNREQDKTHSSDCHFDMPYALDAGIGLNRGTVEYISAVKNEDPWLRAFRLQALETFLAIPMPEILKPYATEDLNFDKIRYYLANN